MTNRKVGEMQSWIGHNGGDRSLCTFWELKPDGNEDECYNRFLKSAVTSDLKEQSLKQWQSEWERTTKAAITKYFFPQNSRQDETDNQCNP
jgi:hypothetical protein